MSTNPARSRGSQALRAQPSLLRAQFLSKSRAPSSLHLLCPWSEPSPALPLPCASYNRVSSSPPPVCPPRCLPRCPPLTTPPAVLSPLPSPPLDSLPTPHRSPRSKLTRCRRRTSAAPASRSPPPSCACAPPRRSRRRALPRSPASRCGQRMGAGSAWVRAAHGCGQRGRVRGRARILRVGAVAGAGAGFQSARQRCGLVPPCRRGCGWVRVPRIRCAWYPALIAHPSRFSLPLPSLQPAGPPLAALSPSPLSHPSP